MRIIGLDLAITRAHKAVVMDEHGTFVTPVLAVATWPDELAAMLQRAREGAPPDRPVAVVMEPTGLAGLPVAVYLMRHPVTVYLVNSQPVADLRRYYHKHAKSDRIDARVLAKLPLVSPEKLHPLVLPPAALLKCQRACKQLDWVITQITALHNQLTGLDRRVWLGGWRDHVFADPFGPAARWCREQYYDPTAVLRAGPKTIRQAWRTTGLDPADDGAWAEALVRLAKHVMAVYGDPSTYVDFAALQAEVRLIQKWLAQFEADRDQLRRTVVRSLYPRFPPSRHLETLKGIGQDSAAVFVSFIGDPPRLACAICG